MVLILCFSMVLVSVIVKLAPGRGTTLVGVAAWGKRKNKNKN